jgi:hypothetical protein
MSWRRTQLDQSLCDQDRLILQLFENRSVKYIGQDAEFAEHLTVDNDSSNLVLIINHPVWCSELIALCKTYMSDPIQTFYIGINRYCIKGNDTTVDINLSDSKGQDIIDFISNQAQASGYVITQSGHYDQDLGRYFNFVQPLTWVYGNKTTNQSN